MQAHIQTTTTTNTIHTWVTHLPKYQHKQKNIMADRSKKFRFFLYFSYNWLKKEVYYTVHIWSGLSRKSPVFSHAIIPNKPKLPGYIPPYDSYSGSNKLYTYIYAIYIHHALNTSFQHHPIAWYQIQNAINL